nr:hypothetical protein [Pseudoxanthomonas sp.]
MTARRFAYRAFVAGWRELAAARELDARTGLARETVWEYRLDARARRVLVRVPVQPDPEPACLVDEDSATWWAVPALWAEVGPNHSSVEAEALASIAAQARAAAGQPEPQTISDVVREALAELRAERAAQHTISLADLHARRGARVEYIDMGGWLRPILVEAA